MHFREVRKLCSLEDLRGVEQTLRSLYCAADGTSCQALLTMEYQLWRNRVLQLLLHTPPTDGESPQVLAYLCGYKLMYTQHQCVIAQILPDTCSAGKCLRTQPCPQQAPRQMDSDSIFKKQRICLFPPQV